MNRIPLSRFKELAGITPSGASIRDIAERAVESARLSPKLKAEIDGYYDTLPHYAIGIDPGVSCGYAVWNRRMKRFDVVDTLTFWEVMDRVQVFSPHEAKVIVEVAHFAPTYRHLKAEGTNANTLSKIARNVGQVTREAQLLVEGLRRVGYTVQEVKPQGKKDAAEFKRITGWPGRTNQHERDSAMLAYFA